MVFHLECQQCFGSHPVQFEAEKQELLPQSQAEALLFFFLCDGCLKYKCENVRRWYNEIKESLKPAIKKPAKVHVKKA